MSESPCVPITPFYVLSSVPTCALKSPSRTTDSADVTFCKAIPTSSKKGWSVLQRLVRTPAKCTVTAPVAEAKGANPSPKWDPISDTVVQVRAYKNA